MLVGSLFAEDEFDVVAPSRPGYLRTPLTSGQTPEQQADAMAALIDTMGIPSVAVVASSSGAPAAIQFVLRHPDRVWALVLLSPVTRFASDAPLSRADFGKLLFDRFTGDFGAWLAVEAVERDPRRMLERIFEMENQGTQAERETLTDYILNDADQLEWLRSLVGTFVPPSARATGFRNDLQQLRAPWSFPSSKLKHRPWSSTEWLKGRPPFRCLRRSPLGFPERSFIRSRGPVISWSWVRGRPKCKPGSSNFCASIPGASPNLEE